MAMKRQRCQIDIRNPEVHIFTACWSFCMWNNNLSRLFYVFVSVLTFQLMESCYELSGEKVMNKHWVLIKLILWFCNMSLLSLLGSCFFLHCPNIFPSLSHTTFCSPGFSFQSSFTQDLFFHLKVSPVLPCLGQRPWPKPLSFLLWRLESCLICSLKLSFA